MSFANPKKNQSIITKKWQGDFSHNWTVLKTPDLLSKMQHLSLASSEDSVPSSIDVPDVVKIVKKNPNFSAINFNFNFCRNTVIILDLSENSKKVDIKPNRFTYILNKLKLFV
jgi:hypothetical protein